MTAEEFLQTRHELPDGGRWTELVDGQLIVREPPEELHGNAVLNLCKILAGYAGRAPGYACFELGLIVARDPDNVWFPAVCWFGSGDRFALLDEIATIDRPTLIVDVAAGSRREEIPNRMAAYQEMGVNTVWIVDPLELRVATVRRGESAEERVAGETVAGGPDLPGLRVDVDELFAEPAWYRG